MDKDQISVSELQIIGVLRKTLHFLRQKGNSANRWIRIATITLTELVIFLLLGPNNNQEET